MPSLYKGSNKIKDRGSYGVYAGSQPIEQIYKGSDLVYQFMPYDPDTVLFNDGNKTDLTFGISLMKGLYRIKLVGAGDAASSGYYYWPAGNRGSLIDCKIRITSTTNLSVVCGNGGASWGGQGGSSILSLNNQTAITCPSGGAITINNSVINIQEILSQDNGGGGGGSGANPTALSPWGDGGYTYSAEGRGGGFYLQYLGVL